jgi:DNA topoisomerase VI subunit A
MGKSKKLDAYAKRVLICGGLAFDPYTGKAYGNKKDRELSEVYFKEKSQDRLLLEYFLANQERKFSYQEIRELFDKGKKVVRQSSDEKYVNDKIEAIKRKLLKLGFSRSELKMMFVCDNGYRLVPPREGKKFVPQK